MFLLFSRTPRDPQHKSPFASLFPNPKTVGHRLLPQSPDLHRPPPFPASSSPISIAGHHLCDALPSVNAAVRPSPKLTPVASRPISTEIREHLRLHRLPPRHAASGPSPSNSASFRPPDAARDASASIAMRIASETPSGPVLAFHPIASVSVRTTPGSVAPRPPPTASSRPTPLPHPSDLRRIHRRHRSPKALPPSAPPSVFLGHCPTVPQHTGIRARSVATKYSLPTKM